MKNDQDHFEVLRKIQQVPDSSQRELAQELGFSLGKLNYCLKALQKKGFIKLQNFQKKSRPKGKPQETPRPFLLHRTISAARLLVPYIDDAGRASSYFTYT